MRSSSLPPGTVRNPGWLSTASSSYVTECIWNRLRRAQKSGIDYIKEFLKERFGTVSSTEIWETRPTKSGKQPKLPKRLWRYFVIEFGNDDPNLDLLESALTVAPVGLDIGFAKIRMDLKGVVRPACLYRAPSLFQSLSALNLSGADRDEFMQSLGKAEGRRASQSLPANVSTRPYTPGPRLSRRVVARTEGSSKIFSATDSRLFCYFGIGANASAQSRRPI